MEWPQLPLATEITKQPTFSQSGIPAMLVASFFFAGMSALGKAAGRTMPALEICFFRSAGSLVLLGSLALVGRLKVMQVSNVRGLVLRSVAGTISMIAWFWSVVKLPLADAMLLSYSSPIFTAFWAWWRLSERPSRWTWAGLAIATLGLAVLVGPDHLLWQPASLVALGGAVLAGLAYVQVRELGATEDPWTIVFWFMAAASVVTLPLALPHFQLPSGVESWQIVGGLGLTATLAQGAMTIAYRLAPAASAAVASLATVVFSAIWGSWWFHESPSLYAWLGGGLILAGGALASGAIGRSNGY